jgi:hypothetical protein
MSDELNRLNLLQVAGEIHSVQLVVRRSVVSKEKHFDKRIRTLTLTQTPVVTRSQTLTADNAWTLQQNRIFLIQPVRTRMIGGLFLA